MTMRIAGARRAGLALALALLGFGCCHQPTNEITLDDALKQVGQGLHDMHAAAHPPVVPKVDAGGNAVIGPDGKLVMVPAETSSFGLFVDQVAVTFNVQSSTTKQNSNKLVISADVAPPAIPVKAGLSDTISTSTTEKNTRGNTITILFKNPIFSSTGELAHDTITGPPPASAPSPSKATTKPSGGAQGQQADAGAGADKPEPAAPPEKSGEREKSFERLIEFIQRIFKPIAIQ
jgi:hypothetical protein